MSRMWQAAPPSRGPRSQPAQALPMRHIRLQHDLAAGDRNRARTRGGAGAVDGEILNAQFSRPVKSAMAKFKEKRCTARNVDDLLALAVCFDFTAVTLGQVIRHRFAVSKGPLTQPTVVPSIVNSALAIELYLKAFHQYDCGDFLKTHSLIVLFGELREDRKQRLRELWRDSVIVNLAAAKMGGDLAFAVAANNIPASLDDLLAKAEKAFEEWRYFGVYGHGRTAILSD